MQSRNKKIGAKVMSTAISVISITVISALLYSAYHYRHDVLPVEHVRIEGAFDNVDRKTIRGQVLANINGGYFTIDLHTIRNALLDLPWVEDASVRRQWPATLDIQVAEKQAIAYWADNSLLSSKGELFTPTEISPAMPLPRLRGPEGHHLQVWEKFRALQASLGGLDFVVEQMTLDARRSWSVRLNGETFTGLDLRIGRTEFDHRIQRFIRVFSMRNAPALAHADYLDLRYPNGFAMGMRERTEAGAG